MSDSRLNILQSCSNRHPVERHTYVCPNDVAVGGCARCMTVVEAAVLTFGFAGAICPGVLCARI